MKRKVVTKAMQKKEEKTAEENNGKAINKAEWLMRGQRKRYVKNTRIKTEVSR